MLKKLIFITLLFISNFLYPMESNNDTIIDIESLQKKIDLPKDIWLEIMDYLDVNDKAFIFLAFNYGISDFKSKEFIKAYIANFYNLEEKFEFAEKHNLIEDIQKKKLAYKSKELLLLALEAYNVIKLKKYLQNNNLPAITRELAIINKNLVKDVLNLNKDIPIFDDLEPIGEANIADRFNAIFCLKTGRSNFSRKFNEYKLTDSLNNVGFTSIKISKEFLEFFDILKAKGQKDELKKLITRIFIFGEAFSHLSTQYRRMENSKNLRGLYSYEFMEPVSAMSKVFCIMACLGLFGVIKNLLIHHEIDYYQFYGFLTCIFIQFVILGPCLIKNIVNSQFSNEYVGSYEDAKNLEDLLWDVSIKIELLLARISLKLKKEE